MQLPKTEKEWEDIALAFEKKWHFTHCVGALIAKHIAIDKPHDEPEKYFNHKHFHSIVLVAVVSANYEFSYVNVGFNGAFQYIYVSTEFFENLTLDSLGLPKDCPLRGGDKSMPYVFLGETDFLIENIMRPFPSGQVAADKKIFNYRFSRAKRVADNALGIFYERFGLFHKNISVKEENLNSVVLACCALHNYLINRNKGYLDEDSLDAEDLVNVEFKPASWRRRKDNVMDWADTHPLLSLSQKAETVADSKGAMVRDTFTSYFNDVGKVPFQDQMVNVVPEL